VTETEDRPGWYELLHQDEIWIDRDGAEIRLDDMSPRYCGNVLSLVVRAAPSYLERLWFSMASSPGPSGDMASDAFDSEMDRLLDAQKDPARWAESTELVQALRRRMQGLPAAVQEEDMSVEDAVDDGYTFDRNPLTVRAVRFTGGNLSEVAAVAGRMHRVEETMISGPGPCRGMQKAVNVWSVNDSAAVPVGSWLVIDGEKLSSVPDHEFTGDYTRQNGPVEAEILCYCGDPTTDGQNHVFCYPGMD
jgi:hypothetical protein